jgi:hypothetical protein
MDVSIKGVSRCIVALLRGASFRPRRTFEVDEEVLDALAALRITFGVRTNAQVICKCLALARTCARHAYLEDGAWLVDFIGPDGSRLRVSMSG